MFFGGAGTTFTNSQKEELELSGLVLMSIVAPLSVGEGKGLALTLCSFLTFFPSLDVDGNEDDVGDVWDASEKKSCLRLRHCVPRRTTDSEDTEDAKDAGDEDVADAEDPDDAEAARCDDLSLVETTILVGNDGWVAGGDENASGSQAVLLPFLSFLLDGDAGGS